MLCSAGAQHFSLLWLLHGPSERGRTPMGASPPPCCSLQGRSFGSHISELRLSLPRPDLTASSIAPLCKGAHVSHPCTARHGGLWVGAPQAKACTQTGEPCTGTGEVSQRCPH